MYRQPVHVREEEASKRSQDRWFRISPVLVGALPLPSPASMLALQLARPITDPIWPGPVSLHGALHLVLACVA